MECAAGTDDIKIVPKGCTPVSEDRCASGFMAPVESVVFPENALEQCCKCKEGQPCGYCLDKECTDAEKKKYVTDKDCYVPPPPPPSTPTEELEKNEETFDTSTWVPLFATLFVFVSLVALYFNLPSLSPWRPRVLIVASVLVPLIAFFMFRMGRNNF